MLAPAATTKRRFQLVLIKPSHYDDDGYVVQWRRSSIPSNSLACVYALAAEAASRSVLGSDVDIDLTALDETNTRIKPNEIIDLIRRHHGFGSERRHRPALAGGAHTRTKPRIRLN